jgi:signal transduction histidine kinase
VNLDEESLALLVAGSGRVALRLDGTNAVTGVGNLPQLQAWLKQDAFQPGPDAQLAPLLDILFDAPQADRIQAQAAELRALPHPASLPVALLPGRIERLALRQRWFECSLHPGAPDPGASIVLLLIDVSERQELNLALEGARAARDLALTVLRTDANAMRTMRDVGIAAIATIRAALRLPARTQEALQVKLGRMQHEADALGGQAQVLALNALVQACEELTSTLVSLRQKDGLSGDALLPVAPRIDAIAVALAELERIDAQRAPPPVMPVTSPLATVRNLPGSTVPWRETSELRWRTYVHQMGDSLGVLARLKFIGAEVVPARFQRHVDAILHALLDNALQHGIEDFERRLKADKPAAGQITVTFRDLGPDGTEMTVHDDGDGFDVERIGRAAVHCGLLTEAALEDQDKADVMGLIFKPNFTTEGLPGNAGRGRGIASVRRTVTRAGGKVAVATKRHRYTLFTIRLPALARATAAIRQKAASAS